MTPSELSTALRSLADGIESGAIPNMHFTRLSHMLPITKPETGDMIVDAQYMGMSVVLTTLPVTSDELTKIRRILETRMPRIR